MGWLYLSTQLMSNYYAAMRHQVPSYIKGLFHKPWNKDSVVDQRCSGMSLVGFEGCSFGS